VTRLARLSAHVALLSSALLALIPSGHAHWVTETSLRAHEHLWEGGDSADDSSAGVSLSAASTDRHSACLGCLRASQRTSPPGSSLSAVLRPASELGALGAPDSAPARVSSAGLPPGRAPPRSSVR
jgi:hypothetical protein